MKDAVQNYYGDYYKSDRAFNKISDLKETGTVQRYLNDIDRLNVYANMTDHQLKSLILNVITAHLHQAIAHYDSFHINPSK